jgi:hypothetical protein
MNFFTTTDNFTQTTSEIQYLIMKILVSGPFVDVPFFGISPQTGSRRISGEDVLKCFQESPTKLNLSWYWIYQWIFSFGCWIIVSQVSQHGWNTC